MKRHVSFLAFIGILLLAFAVRLLYNLQVAGHYTALHDSLTYETIAFNILHQQCYCLLPHLATVDRAPLWPAMIAFIYKELDPHNFSVRYILCLIGSGTCGLIFLFAKDLFGRGSAIFAGVLAAIYPFLYVYDGWLYSESVYTFLLLAFCYTLYHLQRRPQWKLMALAGVLLGLISLTRPNGLLILGLVILWAMIVGWRKIISWRAAAQSALTISLISLVLVLPWTIRNYSVTQAFVPVAVGDGKVMLGAYNDSILSRAYYLGTWIIPSESSPAIAAQYPKNCAGPCEVKRDSDYRMYAVQWIEAHLDSVPELLGLHFINIWQTVPQEADLAINRFPDQASSHFVVLMMEIITPIVFALAALGLWLTRRRWRELLFIYFMIGLTIGQCLILYGIPRFRAPIEPMLILLGTGALWWVGQWFERGGKGRVEKVHTEVVKDEEVVKING